MNVVTVCSLGFSLGILITSTAALINYIFHGLTQVIIN